MEGKILIGEGVCYLCDLAVNVRPALKKKTACGVVLSNHLGAIAHLALPLSPFNSPPLAPWHVIISLLIFYNGRSDDVVKFSFFS